MSVSVERGKREKPESFMCVWLERRRGRGRGRGGGEGIDGISQSQYLKSCWTG